MNFPSRGEHPALELTWRDGADYLPQIPEQFQERQPDGSLEAPELGGAGTVLYRADGEFAITRGSHSGTSRVIPADHAEEHKEALEVERPSLGHAASFSAACMGEDRTRSPFRIGETLTKTLMLGVICQRLDEELHFDRETERFVGKRPGQRPAGRPTAASRLGRVLRDGVTGRADLAAAWLHEPGSRAEHQHAVRLGERRRVCGQLPPSQDQAWKDRWPGTPPPVTANGSLAGRRTSARAGSASAAFRPRAPSGPTSGGPCDRRCRRGCTRRSAGS